MRILSRKIILDVIGAKETAILQY